MNLKQDNIDNGNKNDIDITGQNIFSSNTFDRMTKSRNKNCKTA